MKNLSLGRTGGRSFAVMACALFVGCGSDNGAALPASENTFDASQLDASQNASMTDSASDRTNETGTPPEMPDASAPGVPLDASDAATTGDDGGTEAAPPPTAEASAPDAVVDARLESGSAADSSTSPLVPLSVYLAGDSTVSYYPPSAAPQAGWGQELAPYFKPLVTVQNKAIGGRTARRYIEEGHLTEILNLIKAGDYLLIQFGTNDSNTDPKAVYGTNNTPYYTAPAAFETYLQQYIDGARAHGANPVLVTPPPQRTCMTDAGDSFVFDDSRFVPYVAAMMALGMQTNTPVLDLNKRALTYLESIGCFASANFFLVVGANGVADHTHFKIAGAQKLAGFVVDELRAHAVPLVAYLN